MAAPSEEKGLPPRARQRPHLFSFFAPVVVFAALAGIFLYMLLGGGDPRNIPSALIGRPAPEFALKPLDGLERAGGPVPGFSSKELAEGEVSIINVWASWCVPCRAEHPYLMELAEHSRARLYGLNYKDKPANARRFLGQLGNPFRAVGVDDTGRAAIDWGVYGVPETFIVDGAGIIRFKHVGPLTPDILVKFRELVEKLDKKPAAAN